MPQNKGKARSDMANNTRRYNDHEAYNRSWGDETDEDARDGRSRRRAGYEDEDEEKLGGKVGGDDLSGIGLIAETRLGGVVPTFMPADASKALNRPAQDPIKWKAYYERFDFMPYESPVDEFNRNTFLLNRETLHYRWEGMGMEKEIEKLFINYHESYCARAVFQDQLAREHSLPNQLDPKNLEIAKNWQLHSVNDRLKRIKWQIDNGVELTVEDHYRLDQGGTIIKEECRPLKELSRARLDRDFRAYIDTWRKLTGEDGKTLDVNLNLGGSLRELLVQGMTETNYRGPSGLTLAELEAVAYPTAPALPQYVEGEIISERQNQK